MNIRPEIGIVILAAGASRRMGQPKQLLTFKGETLIRHAIKVALETACHPVIVVIPPDQPLLQKELEDLQIYILENRDFQEGMSTSIRVGLEGIRAEAPQSEAVLIMVVDQPFVNTTHLSDLVSAYNGLGKSIIASAYNNQLGVPALFDKKWFAVLMQLTGDQGARNLLKNYPAEVHAIPFPDGAFDLDTPENYNFLRTHFE